MGVKWNLKLNTSTDAEVKTAGNDACPLYASSWRGVQMNTEKLNKERPTWWCGIRMQGEACIRITHHPSQTTTKHQHASYQNNTTHEITQQISRKLLRMDVLTSETCWALNKEIKSKWHQIGLSLFNYQDDARSNKHTNTEKFYLSFVMHIVFIYVSSFSTSWVSTWNITLPAVHNKAASCGGDRV